ncbi:MAG: hypothetical protein CBC08_00015 [Flavobacteriaceae bacterium TMED48]|nr:MAG: hypothetical protein CBC08_00015 [Flavobacteriaceae bacterium TMED48]|tara:strand:+ start:1468 stop:4380 length:2913 start_codon:yes stop_codon:yes gene_type:complete
MPSITQTIPSFTGGLSEQPDQLKFPGQVKDVQNAIPDITKGLYKRPGAKRVGTDPLPNVATGGSWFHYHRDEEEGSYIGQVAADGTLRMWKASGDNAGAEQNITYGTGGEAAIKNYLATSNSENIQFLTINDTTFVNSRDATNANTLIGKSGTTTANPDPHFAFIEITRTENGRQYGMNLYNNNTETSFTRATRIQILSDTLDESGGTGQCRGIGIQTFSCTAASSYTGTNTELVTDVNNTTVTSGKNNLIFKLDIRGQQGNIGADGDSPDDFACAYSRQAILLHGGEGWAFGDQVTVTMSSAKGRTVSGSSSSGTSGNSGKGESPATYIIEVMEHETITVKANLKLSRPSPTPFDAETAVSSDTVLGGILGDLPTGINGKIIGNGIYMSSATSFNAEIVEDDLMRSMGTSVNDVSLLPKQCKHGYIVKISNARQSDEDDYYLRFEGLNDQDGTGSWVECAKPGIDKDLTNMPLVIQRTALANQGTSTEIATFTIKQFTYGGREVGDDNSNPYPSFVDKRINRVLFFRNRLAFLAGENVVLCRPGTLGSPDFFAETALTVSPNDPIDISCSSNFPSELFDGIDINSGLVVFSTNQQFLLSSDDTVLNPDTAKLRSISTFNYNKNIRPISLGTTVAYMDNSGKFSRFMEMANIAREGEPNVVNQSQVVPTLIPKNVDLFTNSRENNLVLIGKTDSDEVQGFRYLNVGDKRQQSAWFRWKFNNPIKYQFVINDEYYFLDTDNFLQEVRLVQTESDPFIVQDNVDYLLHIDNHISVTGGTFNHNDNKTTFFNNTWIPLVTTPSYDLVAIDTNTASTRVGRYAKATILPHPNQTTFTLPGDWSGTSIFVGYLYEYKVLFPTFYVTQTQGQQAKADVNSSLVVHRMKLHFGKIGLYETTLSRVGKNDYTEVYESTELDEYDVSDAPYIEEFIKTIPVYERNTNVDITLKSQHPAPSTLRAVSWEGDFSPKYYKRV